MGISFDPYLFLFSFWEKFGSTPYFKLVLILGGLFFLVVLLSYVRKHVFKISMRGAVFGFFLGAFLILLLDLVLLAAMADKNKFQGVFSGEKRQEALGEVLISGMTNLSQVLGVSTIVTSRKPKTAQEVIGDFLFLPNEETQKVKNLLCPK